MKVVSGTEQLIGKNGDFNCTQLKRLCSEESATASHTPCTVISIVGPQNTGKSYLLNHLFGTSFRVSEAELCYEQTTVGIWTARCISPSMIIMDVEGSDSGDRALEGTSFENKIALFALATSDAMLLNIKVQDFGKYNAGCRPLLNIIFQERAKLAQRRTKLIVVFRDCKNPDEVKKTSSTVYSTLKEIWLTVHPSDRISPKFDDYIEVLVEAFPFYEKVEYFEQKCSEMRKMLMWKMLSSSGHEGSHLTHTASGFPSVAAKIWDDIQNNRTLDIPSLQILQANHMCDVIIEEIRSSLGKNTNFLALEDMSDSTSPDTFKGGLNALLNSISSRFEQVTNIHVHNIRDKKKEDVVTEILMKFQDKFELIVQNKLNNFMEENKSLIYYYLLDGERHDDVVSDCLKRFDNLKEGFPTQYKKVFQDSACNLEKRVRDYIQQEEYSDKRIKRVIRHSLAKSLATVAMPFLDSERLYYVISSTLGAPRADSRCINRAAPAGFKIVLNQCTQLIVGYRRSS
ncbi:hypothetical protein LUZ63_009054 [Rhynchospora breviuscula]|uniref:GB1/RHD3-type G domain-containing protein n=1 Tax=Rhynchospora breviuscula TaxID=2022672 RepID=A0A9Q0CEB0_9POAL|nr:hypothetical protein LUZ63_009054 [Rhynchospora breviuscula]